MGKKPRKIRECDFVKVKYELDKEFEIDSVYTRGGVDRVVLFGLADITFNADTLVLIKNKTQDESEGENMPNIEDAKFLVGKEVRIIDDHKDFEGLCLPSWFVGKTYIVDSIKIDEDGIYTEYKGWNIPITCTTLVKEPTLDPTPTTVRAQPHYTKNKIQPMEYIRENNLTWAEGNVIKYISRYRHKDGIKDLEKAKHYIDMAIEDYKKELGE